MTFEDLSVILAIAEEKSITRASERLLIAQPSLSQRLQKVEKELDTKLFLRLRNGIEPTEAGTLFIDMALEVTKRYSEFTRYLNK